MPADEDRRFSTPPTGTPPRGGWRVLRRPRAAELFDAWLFAEVEATLALAAWRSAPTDGKADAYGLYVAALEREAEAGNALARRLAPAAA